MSRRADRSSAFYYGWVITAAFALMMVATWGISQGTFGVLMKPMTADTGWSRTAVSAAFSIHLIVGFVLGVFWGWLSDRWGVRRVMAVTGALMGLGMFLSGLSNTLWQLYLFFGFVAGAGLGGSAGPLTAIATRWFERRRGLAVGIGFAGGSVGTATLAILAEFLISNQGWRFGFQALSYVVWGIFLLTIMFLREPSGESDAPHPSEAPGGEDHGREARRVTAQVAVPLSVAARTTYFWLLFGMMTMSTLIFFLVLVHLVPRAIDLGIPSSRAVTVFTATNIVSMVGTMGGGGLGDRFGPRRVYILAMAFYALGLLWLSIASELWMLYLFAVVFGLGNGAWSPQIPALAARAFGTRYMGAIWGGILLGAGIGGTIGPIMAGAIFDATDSYRIAFIAGAGIAVVGIALAFLLTGRPRVPLLRRRQAQLR